MYFQKGFGLKSEVGPVLARTYQSAVVERLKGLGYEAGAGGLHFKLAKEFGFCYGVDRAVDYAYQTRRQFPDRRVFLSGEIIHNPDVNRRLTEMGIRILDHFRDPTARFAEVAAGDVVICRRSASASRSSRTSNRSSACWSTRRAAACSTSGR